ncbi:hypothetical protein SCALM49S_03910 [Streptomyces californicus]
MEGKNEQRAGLLYGIGAYVMWGLVPLFWPLLRLFGDRESWPTGWSGPWASARSAFAVRRWAWIGELVRDRRKLAPTSVVAANSMT